MSALNCRPGDLAVIVRSAANNDGKIVRCVELDPSHVWAWPNGESWTAPGWRIDQEICGVGGRMSWWVEDSRMRPIRDPGEDARDESLSWLPLPVTTKDAEVSNG